MSELLIYTIRVPNLFVEGRNRIYVIAADPITMIDSGIATDRAYDELVAGLKEHGLAPADIGRIVLTHKHIDHIGNAWRIQNESNAEVFIHESEIHSVTDVDPQGQRFAAMVWQRLDQWGAPPTERPSRSFSSGLKWKIEPARATSLVDGQRIPLDGEELEVIHTPGHTRGSICLKLGNRLFSGDHVLPDISPNIGGGDMRSRGLLGRYLQSLQRVRDLENDDLEVMPGHGDPFTTLRQRCDKLIAHHQQRLENVVTILHEHGELTVYELARRLFGPMEDFHVVLGCAEANAHLEYLEKQNQVRHSHGKFHLE